MDGATAAFGYVVPYPPTDGPPLRVVGWPTQNFDECGGAPTQFLGWYSLTKPKGTDFVEAHKSEEVKRTTKPEEYRYAKVWGYIVSPAAGEGFLTAAGVPNDAAFQGRMQPIGWLLQEA